jgi:hypothetical protein
MVWFLKKYQFKKLDYFSVYLNSELFRSFVNRISIIFFFLGFLLLLTTHVLTIYSLETFPDKIYERNELTAFLFEWKGYFFDLFYQVITYFGFTSLLFIFSNKGFDIFTESMNVCKINLMKSFHKKEIMFYKIFYEFSISFRILFMVMLLSVSILFFCMRIENLVNDITVLNSVMMS